MERNFPKAFKLTLSHEGGYVDHPKDPGGPTNKGVTLKTFQALIKPNATKEDLKKITDEQLQVIYRRNYWDVVMGSKLPNGLDFAVYDFGVNSGPSRAIKFLQKIIGVPQDGKIGPKTLAAITSRNTQQLISQLCDDRLRWLKTLKTWPTFGKGWERRVTGVKAQALQMSEAQDDREIVVEEKTIAVVPAAIDKPVTKTTGFWERITTIGGALGVAGGAWMSDYRVIIALAAAIVVLALVGLVLHGRIINAVKDIKKAVNDEPN